MTICKCQYRWIQRDVIILHCMWLSHLPGDEELLELVDGTDPLHTMFVDVAFPAVVPV